MHATFLVFHAVCWNDFCLDCTPTFADPPTYAEPRVPRPAGSSQGPRKRTIWSINALKDANLHDSFCFLHLAAIIFHTVRSDSASCPRFFFSPVHRSSTR